MRDDDYSSPWTVQLRHNAAAIAASVEREKHAAAFRKDTTRAVRRQRLAACYAEMLRAKPDLWEGGFDVDVAAERSFPEIEPLIRPRS